MPLFSVIIPTYQRINDLTLCLGCLSDYFLPHRQSELGFQIEVIVTDDGDEWEVRQQLADLFPWCRYEKGPSRGPAANRNNGAHLARGSWLVFTDDDCLPQAGWLESYAAHTTTFDVLEGRTSPYGERKRVDEDSPINMNGGSLLSCNFAIRSDIFSRLGGFNENFKAAAMEDNELNARVKSNCFRKQFVPDAHVLHPWRRRKGRTYQQMHAKSVALFVNLHPEYASGFTLTSQLTKVLRSIRANVLFSFESGIYAGLCRQLYLDAYNLFLTWRFIRESSYKP
jgi:glycosyltransferase involved in cell wall biosynthesis